MTNTTTAPNTAQHRIAEIEQDLAQYGFCMEHSLAALAGDGHAIVDMATGEMLEDDPPIRVVQLAEEWCRLDLPNLFAEELQAPTAEEEAPPAELKSIAAAAQALRAHRTALDIEGGADLQVWHLLVSLIHWCEARGVDLEAEFASAREEARATARN